MRAPMQAQGKKEWKFTAKREGAVRLDPTARFSIV